MTILEKIILNRTFSLLNFAIELIKTDLFFFLMLKYTIIMYLLFTAVTSQEIYYIFQQNQSHPRLLL